MSEEVKLLSDLDGWDRLEGFESPIGTHYGIYRSPDKGQLAMVHEDDNEVVMIFDREQKKPTYLNPTTIRGMRSMGFESIEEVQRLFERMKFRQ